MFDPEEYLTEGNINPKPKEIQPKKEKITGKFIPSIPFKFFLRAARSSGKAIIIFLYIWYLTKCSKSKTIKLSNTALLEIGIQRMTKLRSLKKLEEAGLIKVEPKKDGNATTITLTT